MRVEDGGVPPRTRTAILTVNVLRNLNAPRFDNQAYKGEILEVHGIGQSVLQVRATDGDDKQPHNQVTYELDHPYFAINKDGIVTLKSSLLGDGSSNYRVSGHFGL